MTDVWDRAEQATESSNILFGELSIEIEEVVLTKGVGRETYVPGHHKPEQRRDNVSVVLHPVSSRDTGWDMERNSLTNSKAWAGMLLPSINKLGVAPRDISGRWVRVVLEPTGRTWTGRDGRDRTETFPVLTHIYANEAECDAAAITERGGAPATSPAKEAFATADVAAQFIPLLWDQAGHDLAKMAELLKANQVTAQFNLDSPEVMAVIGVAA